MCCEEARTGTVLLWVVFGFQTTARDCCLSRHAKKHLLQVATNANTMLLMQQAY
jgi:hypothetical protein